MIKSLNLQSLSLPKNVTDVAYKFLVGLNLVIKCFLLLYSRKMPNILHTTYCSLIPCMYLTPVYIGFWCIWNKFPRKILLDSPISDGVRCYIPICQRGRKTALYSRRKRLGGFLAGLINENFKQSLHDRVQKIISNSIS